MGTVIVWNGSTELIEQLQNHGLQVKEWPSDKNPERTAIKDAEFGIVVQDGGDEYRQRVHNANNLGLAIALVLDPVEPTAVRDYMLRGSNVSLLIDSATAIREEMLAKHVKNRTTSTPEQLNGFQIGTLWNLPQGITSPEYEEQRVLTLLSPSMEAFFFDLRTALAQMTRERPELPWDCMDQVQDPVDINHLPQTIGRRWAVTNMAEQKVRTFLHTRLKPKTEAWTPLPPPLMLTGESGTGKTLISSMIHDVLTNYEDTTRSRLAMVTGAALESRNFDHVMHGASKGAWTGVGGFVGEFAKAAWGTIFIDELGDMPLDTQTRLNTLFNDLMVEPAGGMRFFSFAHIVAATNRDVDTMVGAGSFRHDLLARFRIRVRVPSLRERPRDERERLIDFVAQDPAVNPWVTVRQENRLVVTHIESDAVRALLDHDFADGNFRELERVVHTALWRARRAGRRAVRKSDLDIQPSRFRAESERRVFDGTRATDGATQLESWTELLRLAELSNAPVISYKDGKHEVVIEGVRYRWVEDGH